MVKHIVIVSDRGQDNIAIYREEPAFVIIAERGDTNNLRHLPQAQLAGLYILMGEDKRYIGQATNLYQRLSIHKREKDWWTQVIFFGREDGRLDKSQLDYLESRLIKDFQETNFVLENATKGNTSWIDPIKEVQARQVWDIAQGILEDIVNMNLFEADQTFEEMQAPHNPCAITLPDGTIIHGKNPSNNQLNLFSYLLNQSPYADRVQEQVLTGKPSSKHLLGTELVLDKNGRPRCVKLSENLYLYTNLSTKDREKAIQRFADQIDLTISINWD